MPNVEFFPVAWSREYTSGNRTMPTADRKPKIDPSKAKTAISHSIVVKQIPPFKEFRHGGWAYKSENAYDEKNLGIGACVLKDH